MQLLLLLAATVTILFYHRIILWFILPSIFYLYFSFVAQSAWWSPNSQSSGWKVTRIIFKYLPLKCIEKSFWALLDTFIFFFHTLFETHFGQKNFFFTYKSIKLRKISGILPNMSKIFGLPGRGYPPQYKKKFSLQISMI